MTDHAESTLRHILEAAGRERAASVQLIALSAEQNLGHATENAWVVQGSVQVLHDTLVLDELLPGSHIPKHARGYLLRASANGAVVALLEGAHETPKAPGADAFPLQATGIDSASASPAKDLRDTMVTDLRRRLGPRWGFLAVAAVTFQALCLAIPLAAGFAIDEVLVFEHRHAWSLCLFTAGIAAVLKYVVQLSAHQVLFKDAPDDVVARGVAYGAWLQGAGAWIAVLFVSTIHPTLGGLMLLGLGAQTFVLVKALPLQQVAADARAAHRISRAHQLKHGLRHAEALVTQGMLETLADDAGRFVSLEEAPQLATGPRSATLVAWLSHVALIIGGAILCQRGNLSVGMMVASIFINMQAQHHARGLLAHAGEFLRPARTQDERRDWPQLDPQPILHRTVPGRRLAVTGGQPRQRTLLARNVCSASEQSLYVGGQGLNLAGSLTHVVGHSGHASTAQVLQALAWSGADTLRSRGIEMPFHPDDPRLSALDRTRLAIANAFCSDPAFLVLDGSLDACGSTLAQALLVNVGRALPKTAVVVFTQRPDIARLCDAEVNLVGHG